MFSLVLIYGFLCSWLFCMVLWPRVTCGTEFNPESTYPHMDRYEADIIDPVGNCPNIICELSYLGSSDIDMLLDKENQKRREYAQANAISNMYRIYWNVKLARFARKKAQMCLPPTFEENQEKYLIFDRQSLIKIFGKEGEEILKYSVIVQVVIGRREEKSNNIQYEANQIAFQLSMIDYYLTLFYSKNESFELRGGTTMMGCGYIFQKTDKSFMDTLLCIYGLLYTGENAYEIEQGQQCTRCDFYTDRYNDSREFQEERSQKWYCDFLYSPLCSDLNKERIFHYLESAFDCNDPKDGLSDDDIPLHLENQYDHEHKRVERASVPCWYITAPMLVIITVILTVCLFHSITAGITLYQSKKKSTKN